MDGQNRILLPCLAKFMQARGTFLTDEHVDIFTGIERCSFQKGAQLESALSQIMAGKGRGTGRQ